MSVTSTHRQARDGRMGSMILSRSQIAAVVVVHFMLTQTCQGMQVSLLHYKGMYVKPHERNLYILSRTT